MNEQTAFVAGKSAEWESVGEGVRRQVLAYGPDLMLVRVDFTKGAVGAIHHHTHRQGTFVVKGRFEVTLGDRTRTLVEGDSFFAAADVPHGVVALADGTLLDTFTPARQDFVAEGE